MWDGMMGIGMVVWLLIGLAVLALLVLGIVWLVRQLGSSSGGRDSSPSSGAALRELEMRYARGEIDRDAYLGMRDDLSRS